MKTLTKTLIGIIFVMSSAVGAQQSHSDKLPLIFAGSIPLSEAFGGIGEYPQPRIYRQWLDELAACEHLIISDADVDSLSYFVVNAQGFQVPLTGPATYFAISNVYTHMIMMSLPKVWEESFVKHEYLHHLLHWNFGEKYQKVGSQHPKEYFGQCGVRLGPFDK